MTTHEKDATDVSARMARCIQSLQGELSRLRTGRASAALIAHLKVTCYEEELPLSQVANIGLADAHTLVVTVWDKALTPAVEKAIHESGLGLNPVTSGEVMRVPMPPLTEERRKQLSKLVRTSGEHARVAIRNIRRDEINAVRAQLKQKELTEDEARNQEGDIQKATDSNIAHVERLIDAKEKEVMEV